MQDKNIEHTLTQADVDRWPNIFPQGESNVGDKVMITDKQAALIGHVAPEQPNGAGRTADEADAAAVADGSKVATGTVGGSADAREASAGTTAVDEKTGDVRNFEYVIKSEDLDGSNDFMEVVDTAALIGQKIMLTMGEAEKLGLIAGDAGKTE